MKRVLIISHLNFWYQGSGDRSRLRSLVEYLSRNTQLTIVYGGLELEEDAKHIANLAFKFELVYLERKEDITLEEYEKRLTRFISLRTFDVCIIEYLELSFCLPLLKSKMKVLLDTHDLHSERNKSFSKFGVDVPVLLDPSIKFTEQQEFDIFKSFDAVITISSCDYEKVSAFIGKEKTILAQHPCVITPRPIRNKVETIGFVGSSYIPNLHGINFFIDEVWPRISGNDIRLEIYGGVGTKLKIDRRKSLASDIVIKGIVASIDEIYQNIDIVINPVQFGAGLKIKNVEALGNCLPLVTTTHAAAGLERGVDSAFLVADDTTEFVESISLLISSPIKRKLMSQGAMKFVENSFLPEQCFNELMKFINNE